MKLEQSLNSDVALPWQCFASSPTSEPEAAVTPVRV